MARVRAGSFEFSLRLWPALLAGAGFALLLSLGTWQLNRAQEKQRALTEFAGNQQLATISIVRGSEFGDFDQRRASAAGVLEADRYFLLDNRTRDGQAGYEVLVPLRLADGQLLLVNRGWLARHPSRAVKPQVIHGVEQVTVTGRLTRPRRGYDLGDMLEPGSAWPHVVQYVSIAEMQPLLGAPLLPLVLRLHDQDELALRTGWPVVSIPPERHYGYAVQWYGLALALVVVFVFASSRRVR